MILAGPDLPRGEVNPTPVPMLDVPAMLLRDHGCEPPPASDGESLAELSQCLHPGRVALSQYHDGWDAPVLRLHADAARSRRLGARQDSMKTYP